MSVLIRRFKPKEPVSALAEDLTKSKSVPMKKKPDSHLTEKPKVERIEEGQLHDAGNARIFINCFGDDLRWNRSVGAWLLWGKNRWEPDQNGQVVRWFVHTMESMATQSRGDADMLKHYKKSLDGPRLNHGLKIAQSIYRGTTIGEEELDQDSWLIGTQNGVVDLKKGEAIEPKREHLITKQMGVSYDKDATCPMWEKFVLEAAQGDHELVDYLQTAVGYSLTGDTSEQCLFFLHGGGNNGKGVFSETISTLLGDYSQTAPESVFSKKGGSGIPTEVARLVGTRFVIAPELGQGMEFHESRIKSMTGDDTITARFLHKDFFDFKPTHKFWISGNHKPKIVGTDDGIWRRFRLLPFLNQVKPEDKDPHLKDKLLKELSGILNWAIEGCLKWKEQGKLITPKCVVKATDGYRQEEDQVGRFLADKTITADPNARVRTLELYEAYSLWTQNEGMLVREKLTQQEFKKAMTAKGYGEPMKSHGNKCWAGFELIEELHS